MLAFDLLCHLSQPQSYMAQQWTKTFYFTRLLNLYFTGLEPSNHCQDTNACSLCSSLLYQKTFSQVSNFNLLSICYPARLQKLQKLFCFLPHPTHPALPHLLSNSLIQLFLHPLLGLYMLEITYSPKASEGKICNSFWKYIIIFWFVN